MLTAPLIILNVLSITLPSLHLFYLFILPQFESIACTRDKPSPSTAKSSNTQNETDVYKGLIWSSAHLPQSCNNKLHISTPTRNPLLSPQSSPSSQ